MAEGRLRTTSADRAQLMDRLDRAARDVRAIRDSWRWRIGCFVVNTLARLIRREATATAMEHLESLVSRDQRPSEGAENTAGLVAPDAATDRPDHADPCDEPWRCFRPSSLMAVALPNSEVPKSAGLSIIVLNRDGATLLVNLFRSLERARPPAHWEIVVVDHASRDNSRAVVEEFGSRLPIRLLALTENRSYSESNNSAARQARYEHLLFLNNDIVLTDPSTLLEGLRALREPTVGVVGLRLAYPHRSGAGPDHLQHAGIRFYPDRRVNFYRPRNLQPAALIPPNMDAYQVPAVTAAALFCRRADFLRLGGFHEGYDYGYEDVDLCLAYQKNLDLRCVVLNRIQAIHDESATQKREDDSEVRARRLRNIRTLRQRFGTYVRKQLRLARLHSGSMWFDGPMTAGIVVPDVHISAGDGDWYAGTALATALAEHTSWNVRLIPWRGNDDACFDAAGLDVLITLVDSYDLSRLRNRRPNLLTVAWMTASLDRWTSSPRFDRYDLYFCSSQAGATRVRERRYAAVQVLRFASDLGKFGPETDTDAKDIDCCFLVDRLQSGGAISELPPGSLPPRFILIGHGWDPSRDRQPYWQGCLAEDELPALYRRSQIVVVDAGDPVAPAGTRICDALATGTMVVTNDVVSAREMFGEMLPTYHSANDLQRLLTYYSGHPNERDDQAYRLQQLVLAHHTYQQRALQLTQDIGARVASALRFAIKVPIPKERGAATWGDYHFAAALARELRNAGHVARLDFVPDWYTALAIDDDVVIAIRGLHAYEPQPDHINLMWNISHPDKVSDDEYNQYDHIFVASRPHAERLGPRLNVPVSILLQCTDPNLFYRDPDATVPAHDLLFVGNSRKQYRAIVRDALQADLPLTIYGGRWRGMVPENYIAAEHIPNERLRKYYSRCRVLLNDHWPSMRDAGFISNRLFDAVACGAYIISDSVDGLEETFGDRVLAYDGTARDLAEKYRLAQLASPYDTCRGGDPEFIKANSFAARAKSILDVVDGLDVSRPTAAGRPPQVPSRQQSESGD